ncbi:MAG TPA: glycosyltransferase [Solirubrobacteraceae bacterium]
MRVVTLIDLLGRHGGGEQIALSIATNLDQTRFDSTLCISRWPPPGGLDHDMRETVDHLAAVGVGLVGLARRGKADFWVWRQLVGLLRRERVDVLHTHKFGSNVWGSLLGRAAGVPVVIAHEHSWEYEGRPVRQILDRHLIARRADRLIAVSREDQRRMVEVEGIPLARTMFLPNGIPRAQPTNNCDVRAELGIEPEAPVIGSVGSLFPVKAFDVLLRATALLTRDRPQLQVLIAGEGTQHEALMALARELGVSGSVRFLGRRNDIPEVLRALNIAVCCSLSEGSPLSVMEYMRAGLPVVASAVGGVPDLIEAGVHGLLVAPSDPQALAAALAELLGDPERARTMGVRAYERQRAEFDLELMVRRIEGLYEELLSVARH